MPRLKNGAVAIFALWGLSAAGAAKAQDAIPGGWSLQVTHQSLGPLTSAPAGWNVAYSPYGVYSPSRVARAGFSGYAEPPRTANTLGFLGDTVRRTSSPRSRRSR